MASVERQGNFLNCEPSSQSVIGAPASLGEAPASATPVAAAQPREVFVPPARTESAKPPAPIVAGEAAPSHDELAAGNSQASPRDEQVPSAQASSVPPLARAECQDAIARRAQPAVEAPEAAAKRPMPMMSGAAMGEHIRTCEILRQTVDLKKLNLSDAGLAKRTASGGQQCERAAAPHEQPAAPAALQRSADIKDAELQATQQRVRELEAQVAALQKAQAEGQETEAQDVGLLGARGGRASKGHAGPAFSPCEESSGCILS